MVGIPATVDAIGAGSNAIEFCSLLASVRPRVQTPEPPKKVNFYRDFRILSYMVLFRFLM
jgi:hypothetical protein